MRERERESMKILHLSINLQKGIIWKEMLFIPTHLAGSYLFKAGDSCSCRLWLLIKAPLLGDTPVRKPPAAEPWAGPRPLATPQIEPGRRRHIYCPPPAASFVGRGVDSSLSKQRGGPAARGIGSPRAASGTGPDSSPACPIKPMKGGLVTI